MSLIGSILCLAGPCRAQQAPKEPMGVALECRVAQGAWRPCRLQMIEMGREWVLLIGQQRLLFRHDGRGRTLLDRGQGSPEAVNASWQNDGSGSAAHLCWDGVCARGDIPLD